MFFVWAEWLFPTACRVWYRPGDFKKLIAPSDPCSVMATMAHGLKALQFYCIYKCTDLTVFSGIPAWQWVAAGTLLAAGQHLNMRVYQLLGQDGVYYGSRFGKTIPWASAWPYNSLRDPQYIGCLLSLAGMASFMPAELVAWWAGNYFYLMWLEVRAGRCGKSPSGNGWPGPRTATLRVAEVPLAQRRLIRLAALTLYLHL